MFEKEIQFIYQYYLNKIKRLDPFVTFGQLASADLHPALLQYVSAEIDYLIFEDRQKLLKESLFDYSGDEINLHFNTISEEIKLTKKFSKEYITKLLLHATSFNTNYVVRPNWSLLQFIFENETEKQVSEVKQILNYLYYYPYYKRILINYFNKKHLYKISESELAGVLNKIDKINMENSFDEIIDESLNNIVGFINSGEVGNDKITKEIIELYLSDKRIYDGSELLNKKLSGNPEDKFKIKDFKKVILEIGEEIQEEAFQKSIAELDTDKGQTAAATDKIEEDQFIAEEKSGEDGEAKTEIEEIVSIENETLELVHPHLEEETEEFEHPDLDESERAESENLHELYDMANEEEKIKETEIEEFEEGERLKIDEDETYPNEIDEIVEKYASEIETDIGKEDNSIDEEYESISLETVDEEYKSDTEVLEELESVENFEQTASLEQTETQNESSEKEEILNDQEIPQEEMKVEANLIEDAALEEMDEPHFAKRFIDIAELLKKRKITRIIEHIFDYDMEQFTSTIEKISECRDEEEAFQIIDSVAQNSYLDESSREIKVFKKIIADLF